MTRSEPQGLSSIPFQMRPCEQYLFVVFTETTSHAGNQRARERERERERKREREESALPRAYVTFWCSNRVFLRLCLAPIAAPSISKYSRTHKVSNSAFFGFFFGCYFGTFIVTCKSVLSSSLSEERLCAILLCLDV